MEILAVACGSALAVVFAAAAVGKLRNRASYAAFVRALAAVEAVPRRWARACAAAVVAAEAAVPPLLAGQYATWHAGVAGFALAAGLLFAFTTVAAATVIRGAHVECRCFGAGGKPMGRLHVVRNGTLTLIAVLGAFATSGGRVEPAQVAVASAAGVVVGMTVIRIEDIEALFRSSTKERDDAVPGGRVGARGRVVRTRPGPHAGRDQATAGARRTAVERGWLGRPARHGGG
ncbi:MauE/DoxX family redox-associated membrane protein [Embleya sp. NPDC005575]|uniref:MauE/DoxX family redox-associated membrane protein n=1 Tax=Embleya sp. NPDC005575 TaxID=3156892 RepID=UPI0033B24BD9